MKNKQLKEIEKYLQDKSYDIDLKGVMDFLKIAKYNWIYPNALVRFTKNNSKLVSEMLEDLYEQGFLIKHYLVSCPYCNHIVGKFEALKDIEEEIFCTNCDNEIEYPTKYIQFAYHRVQE